MVWNWQGIGRKSVETGGTIGTVNESKSSRTWPTYEAADLASRLGGQRSQDAAYMDKYAAAGTFQNEAAQQVYLDKISSDYKEEADECLKREFDEWLQGKHDLNDDTVSYPNEPNAAQRRFVFRDGNPRNANGGGQNTTNHEPGDKMEDWRPTWWGRGSLTHLPGVREYLREGAMSSNDQELAMNILAEFGPQNIDQAWMYFKHWVKGRPLSEATCLKRTNNATDNAEDPSRGPNTPSDSFYRRGQPLPPAKPKNDWDTIKNSNYPADDLGTEPGRPPQAIPRFCVGTEPCNPESRSSTPFGIPISGTPTEADSLSSSASSPPPLDDYVPFHIPPFDPNADARSRAVARARARVGPKETEPEPPNFAWGDVQPITCAQEKQAIEAANFYNKTQDDLEFQLAHHLKIRNNTSDSETKKKAEENIMQVMVEVTNINERVDEVNNSLPFTYNIPAAKLNDAVNEAADNATYMLHEGLMTSLRGANYIDVDGSPITAEGLVEQVRNGTMPAAHLIDSEGMQKYQMDYTKDSTSFAALLPLFIATAANTGMKIMRLTNHVRNCKFSSLSGTSSYYDALGSALGSGTYDPWGPVGLDYSTA